MQSLNYKIFLIGVAILIATVLGIYLLYAYAIMPGLRRVDDVTFVRTFQSIDRSLINPVFMLQFFGPLLMLGGIYIYAVRHHIIGSRYLLLAGIAYFLSVVITLAINVPLNDAIKRINPAADGATMSQARQAFDEAKWSAANLVRIFLSFISILFVAVALCTRE